MWYWLHLHVLTVHECVGAQGRSMAVRQRPRVGDPHEAVIPTAEAGAPHTTGAGKEPTTETLGELRLLFTAPEASRLDDPRRHDQVGPGRGRKSTRPGGQWRR